MFKEIFFISTLIAFCGSTTLNSFGFKDFSTVELSCIEIQEKDRLFTGQCHLEFYESVVAKNIDKVKAYILKESDDLKIDELLKKGFINSTQYFQNTYKEYLTQYNGLFY
jgi:hypothetical protein